MINTLYVGVDVSMKDFKVRYMDDRGSEAAKRQRFDNNQPGLDSFVALILQICLLPSNVTRVVIGMEATSVYGWHLQMGLASDHRLAPYEPQVYTFNPKVIANFKKAYVDLPKDDWTDAWIIADRLRFFSLSEKQSGGFPLLTPATLDQIQIPPCQKHHPGEKLLPGQSLPEI